MAEVGGRRMVAVVLQSSVSLAVWLHGLPLTLERTTYQSYFLPRQRKCRGNYMKIHFALTFTWQCFGQGWKDFIFRVLVFTLATPAKISTRNNFIRLLRLLNIWPRKRSIMCANIELQILLYEYSYMQCNVHFLTSEIVF